MSSYLEALAKQREDLHVRLVVEGRHVPGFGKRYAVEGVLDLEDADAAIALMRAMNPQEISEEGLRLCGGA